MGHQEDFGHPSDFLQNGYLPSEETRVTSLFESERWMVAEERTTALIAGVQPNPESEKLRNAVVDYVQRLITNCFPCQVFAFGSVPLKTYLPDGDIDLTIFSEDQNLKDKWAKELCTMLKNEIKSDTAEFNVEQIQYIQAEVKIVKCLVENIVVDISFNQLGGLCTLCFLEEIDHKIGQNHLFKRSIILIKAWCYYESRILGARHGLISNYALEILVLYVFHIHYNSFAGPLEVLYHFLEFFSKFDWDNLCISLWGPIPINELSDMTVESPTDDNTELRLDKLFLGNLTSVYAVDQNGQDNQELSVLSKYLNILDPLRTNNNLGRSVCKGNFYRIRSAFAYGAKTLDRLLECPDLIYELNQFFKNTWNRHVNQVSPMISDQIARHSSCSNETILTEKVQSSRPYLINEGQRSPFYGEERKYSNSVKQSDQNSAWILHQPYNFGSSQAIQVADWLDFSDENNIFHSDFVSHWQNLQYGRYCQEQFYHGGPLTYPSPIEVPPMYLMGYAPPVVRDEAPIYRGGTGAYIPRPRARNRPSSGARNRRGNHGYDLCGRNAGTGSSSDQLEFGSVGPAHFPRMNEVSHLAEGGDSRDIYEPQRFRGDSPTSTSLHRPSSPQLQRPSSQMNYQLKDEDFPPLSFPNKPMR